MDGRVTDDYDRPVVVPRWAAEGVPRARVGKLEQMGWRARSMVAHASPSRQRVVRIPCAVREALDPGNRTRLKRRLLPLPLPERRHLGTAIPDGSL